MSGEPTFEEADRLESPKLATPSSPPATGAIELAFQANETIGQTSPPHNYRHSRAYRHFKNPPQPHMCIRVSTLQGEELFINVLSWTRIVIPQEPSDPIPLYGGMRVPPGNPRCPALVYAVMANPEVLKDSGRHSKDPEERRAMVELMCDFVEAMNPDIKLTRNAVILKDRDISGELKDVWNAVQAQRDREREEEFARKHGLPSPDSIFYKSALRELQERLQKQQHQQQQYQQQQPDIQPTHNANPTADNKIMYMEFGPESAPHYRKDVQSAQEEVRPTENTAPEAGAQSAISITDHEANSQNVDTKPSEVKTSCEAESDDTTDSTKLTGLCGQHASNLGNSLAQVNNTLANPVNTQQIVTLSPAAPTISTPSSTTTASATATATTVTTVTTTSTSTAPAKKEKLGFLPNGCHSIFPRFKNHKHKDKEKDKEKDSNKSSHNSKEKTLLKTFKKSTAAAASVLGNTQQEDSKTTQFEKNCVNLSADMEKLDISKLESSDVLIKLKVASSGAK